MKILFDGIVTDKFTSVKDSKSTTYLRVLSDKDIVTLKLSDKVSYDSPVMSKCTFEAFMNLYEGKAFFTCVGLTVNAYADFKEI